MAKIIGRPQKDKLHYQTHLQVNNSMVLLKVL